MDPFKSSKAFLDALYRRKNAAAAAAKAAATPAAPPVEPAPTPIPEEPKPVIPTATCKQCKKEFPKEELSKTLYVCPDCGYHFPIPAYYRLSTLLDGGTFREHYKDLKTDDPLKFPGYAEKVAATEEKTGLNECVVCATGNIDGRKAMFVIMDSRFFMGSMSAVVGEKITRSVEHAQKYKLPLVIFCASGGARMQEGIFSLMQMAKTSAAIARFNASGGLYISVLTHPTTGGVSASFATLGDITLAEPGALIGFAGPRVIEQTIGQKLPEGFQRSEYLVEHGFVDAIVPRDQLKDTLSQLLKLHAKKGVK